MSDKKEDFLEGTRVMEEGDGGQNFQTQMLKTMFPGKTDAEIVRINRRFLRDAEPFSLNDLTQRLKKRSESMLTGFAQLDPFLSIPPAAVTLVCGGGKQGKTLFLLNLLLNIAEKVKGKHILYYTYECSREELELKLINMAGEKPFNLAKEKKKVGSNLECWDWKMQTVHEAELLKFADEEPAYRGLKNFMSLVDRIHIIDHGYDLKGLVESIRLFSGPFRIGAVFIDFVQNIPLSKDTLRGDPGRRAHMVLDRLRRFIRDQNFPLVVASQIPDGGDLKLEDEEGWLDWSRSLAGLEHHAALVTAVKRLPHPDEYTLMVRVLANRNGPPVGARLDIHPQFFRLKDSE